MKKRVLFVDDEENILSGLQRMLRPYREEWDIEFASSGQEALAKLAQSNFDCIVSDMRMPGMNGAVLLEEVHKRSPNMVRFILSGHADMEPIMQALPVTHQFLAKPCAPEKLVEAIRRACDLHNMIEDAGLRKIVGTVEALPARPMIYAEIARQLADPNCEIEVIANVIEQDIAITTKLLKVVNSAFFGLPRNISDVQEAVSYLGLGTVKSLVLSEEMAKCFSIGNKVPGFSIDYEQILGVQVANVAKKLIKEKKPSEDAFMAGMLHRVGRLILAQHAPDKLIEIQKLETQNQQRDAAEIAVLGNRSGHVGAYLLGLWGLPYPVVEGVAHQCCPWEVTHEGFQVLDALYVAICLVGDKNGAPIKLDEGYLDKLGVKNKLPEWREIAAKVMGGES
ncbi:MAG: HDOD domain-containing protein [Gammaproteobacteria bacterium]|nr:HDOD domain-containing protein [Gammaproteobacteria bacterium]